MDISKYIGIKYHLKYTAKDLDNMLSKFNNLDMGNYYATRELAILLRKQSVQTIINFINMFKDVNQYEYLRANYNSVHSLSGFILAMIRLMHTNNQVCIYKIMDHLLKLNMNTLQMCFATEKIYDINYYEKNHYSCEQNHTNVLYVVNNYAIIQNVRKTINNNDILLFDITNDLQFIELILLISKCKHKNLPKFIIIHKILYYYLLDKNIMYNLS